MPTAPPPTPLPAPDDRASRAPHSPLGSLGRRLDTRITVAVGIVSLVLAVVGLATTVDGEALRRTAEAMGDDPAAVSIALAAFVGAFVVRAGVWVRVLPRLPFGQALAALGVSVGANHVLPLRLGEPLRIVSAVRRSEVTLASATASVVTLRAADVLAMALLGVLAGPALFTAVLGGWGFLILVAVAIMGAVGLAWLVRLRRSTGEPIRLPVPVVAAGSTGAWLLESVLVWQCAHFAGIDLSFGGAVLVTCAAVAAQTVAIAPSGLGTYEAASVAAYVALGHDAEPALAAALAAHALKTAASLVGGAVGTVAPAPGLLGRFRLRRPASGRRRPDRGSTPPTGGAEPDAESRPVVLVLPAHDEAATVRAVVRRAPAEVGGHPVRVVVVDDGSADSTGERARDAGAEVLSFPRNRGLGAAVRAGLARAVELDAVAVAFCDADGEYAPEELARVVAPVLDGEADYVVGSRFAGRIEHMHPHRRLGNRVLTVALSWVARRPITDGQSGYRALSPDAAAHAEILHDFNYAQVLTLDLLAKGFRYREVPISYRFRTEGESFIRLGRYLRAVGPAVYRELNTA